MSYRGEQRDLHIHISVSHLILIVFITLDEDHCILMASLHHEIGFKACQVVANDFNTPKNKKK